jgi:hypothetical protein
MGAFAGDLPPRSLFFFWVKKKRKKQEDEYGAVCRRLAPSRALCGEFVTANLY